MAWLSCSQNKPMSKSKVGISLNRPNGHPASAFPLFGYLWPACSVWLLLAFSSRNFFSFSTWRAGGDCAWNGTVLMGLMFSWVPEDVTETTPSKNCDYFLHATPGTRCDICGISSGILSISFKRSILGNFWLISGIHWRFFRASYGLLWDVLSGLPSHIFSGALSDISSEVLCSVLSKTILTQQFCVFYLWRCQTP